MLGFTPPTEIFPQIHKDTHPRMLAMVLSVVTGTGGHLGVYPWGRDRKQQLLQSLEDDAVIRSNRPNAHRAKWVELNDTYRVKKGEAE